MNFVNVFLFITAFVSVVSFHFYKILSEILNFISIYCIDEYVPSIGFYTNKLPLEIILVNIDKQIYTNKLKLFLNWYWDFEMGGFNILECPIDFTEMVIYYKIKHNNAVEQVVINKELNTIVRNNIEEDILFNECRLI